MPFVWNRLYLAESSEKGMLIAALCRLPKNLCETVA